MKNLLILGKGDTRHSDVERATFVRMAKKAGFDTQQADYHEIGNLRGFNT